MIVLLHNDLDAVGSELCIRQRFIIDQCFYTNYSDMQSVIESLLEYAEKHDEKQLIIADLSFANKKDILETLCCHFDTILHIDHHSYDRDFFKNLDVHKCKYKSIINTSVCASKLCMDTFKINLGFLHNLIKIIDIYDCWRSSSPHFDKAQNLNNYFWEVGYHNFLTEFSKFKIPENYKSVVESVLERQNKKIQELKDKNLIVRSTEGERITFVFNFEVFNPVMIKEMQEGQRFVVGIEFNTVRFRIAQNYFLDDDLEVLRQRLCGCTTGHLNAFTYKFNSDTLTECKRISQIVNEIDFDIPF